MTLAQNLNQKSVLIVKHGVEEYFGGPAEDLERFLVSLRVKKLIVISHPLLKHYNFSTLRIYKNGNLVESKSKKRLLYPPFSFVFDIFVFKKLFFADLSFGFNALATLYSCLLNVNVKKKIIMWSVDFVPIRRINSFATSIFYFLSKLVGKIVDIRIENNSKALRARNIFYPSRSKTINLVVPIGIWDLSSLHDDFDFKVPKKLIYVGSIEERTGGRFLINLAKAIEEIEVDLELNIVGQGELQFELQDLISKYNSNKVKYHGPLPDGPRLQDLLDTSYIALAPYVASKNSYSRFADPGKLKKYLSHNLVIFTTKVPPNSIELNVFAGAIIMGQSDTPVDWISKIANLVEDRPQLEIRSKLAHKHALNFVLPEMYIRLLSNIL
jgi:glycosyltransferase involved in cell wall biosynthesis